jgi:hypothetical protein
VGWHKSKRDGKYDVYVYDPAVRRKRYVGRRELEREAKALFRQKTAHFLGEAAAPAVGLTCGEYAPRWLAAAPRARARAGRRAPPASTTSRC